MTLQEEIKSIMLKHGISYQWIAEKLGTYYQKVQYALDFQKEMPFSTYTAIMQVFEKHNFIQDSITKCDDLIELSFITNSKIGSNLKNLNDQIKEYTQDKKFTADERVKMRNSLETILEELTTTINNLIKLTEVGL